MPKFEMNNRFTTEFYITLNGEKVFLSPRNVLLLENQSNAHRAKQAIKRLFPLQSEELLNYYDDNLLAAIGSAIWEGAHTLDVEIQTLKSMGTYDLADKIRKTSKANSRLERPPVNDPQWEEKGAQWKLAAWAVYDKINEVSDGDKNVADNVCAVGPRYFSEVVKEVLKKGNDWTGDDIADALCVKVGVLIDDWALCNMDENKKK